MTEKLYLNPMGYTTVRPNVELPRIDRGAVLRNAHVIAKRYRAAYGGSYADAMSYGLKAAWGQWQVSRSIQSLAAQVTPRTFTAAEIAGSRAATRRCGSSYIGM
jgi:hypothetical protein